MLWDWNTSLFPGNTPNVQCYCYVPDPALGKPLGVDGSLIPESYHSIVIYFLLSCPLLQNPPSPLCVNIAALNKTHREKKSWEEQIRMIKVRGTTHQSGSLHRNYKSIYRGKSNCPVFKIQGIYNRIFILNSLRKFIWFQRNVFSSESAKKIPQCCVHRCGYQCSWTLGCFSMSLFSAHTLSALSWQPAPKGLG